MYGFAGDTPDTLNPLTDAIAQAKQRGSSAALFGLAFVIGAAFLVFRKGRR